MYEKKLMINVFGPSTAGKSTISELLKEEIDRLYAVDFDVVKRQISGYEWKRDGVVATELTFDTITAVARQGLAMLVLLPPPKKVEAYQRIAEIASDYGYRLINIEITAPHEVLINRYEQRLREVRVSGSSWKFKTPEEFKANLDVPYFRPDGTITFDSSESSPEEIFVSIRKALGTS